MYKVFRKNKGLYSLFPQEWEIEYPVGVETIPKIGKIFVFDTLFNAASHVDISLAKPWIRRACYHLPYPWEIWEVETGECEQRIYVPCHSKDYRNFWEKNTTDMSLKEVAFGTVLTNMVKLIKRIDKREWLEWV